MATAAISPDFDWVDEKTADEDPLNLVDPLSLKDAGSVPADSLTKIGTNNGLRRALRTAIAHFGLSSPDAAVRLDSVRTAGGGFEDAVDRVVFGAGAPDVTDVVVGGHRVVEGGEHLLLGDVGGLISDAVAGLG